MRTDRRLFLAATAGAPLLAAASATRAQTTGIEKTVSFRYDFVPVSARDAAARLAALAAKADDVEDQYLKGGSVGRLEAHVAALFDKEDAVFLPTGTMANSIALRLLCGERRRALVQRESHVYLDEGDASAVLDGIALAPVGAGKAAPDPEEVLRLITEARTGSYPAPFGAISLESPVRRHEGSAVPFDVAQAISQIAKREGIRMHWDGARALMLLGTPGFDLRATAGLFDTVYLSLYKYLGAPYGAVLTGPSDLISRAKELRHTYGGTVYQAWPAVLPALDSLRTFDADIRAARGSFERVLARLGAVEGFSIERPANASNIVFLRMAPERARGLVEGLAAHDIQVKEPVDGRLAMTLNLSVLRRPVDDIVRAFQRA
jgi:threonine aldolase